MDLRISRHPIGDYQVLALEGTADLAALPRLHDALTKLVGSDTSGRCAVDLDGVTLVDDATLGLLLGAAARARAAGGSLTIVCSASPLRDRLAATLLDQVIDVVPSLTTSR